jgi:hypothetical protein
MIDCVFGFWCAILFVEVEADRYVGADAAGTFRRREGIFTTLNINEDVFASVSFRGGQEPLGFGEGHEHFVNFGREKLVGAWAMEDKSMVGLLYF